MAAMQIFRIQTLPQLGRTGPARGHAVQVRGRAFGVGVVVRRQPLEPRLKHVDQQRLAEAARTRQELVAVGQQGWGTRVEAGWHRGQQVPKEPCLIDVEAPDPADGDKGRLAGMKGREMVYRLPIFRVPSNTS